LAFDKLKQLCAGKWFGYVQIGATQVTFQNFFFVAFGGKKNEWDMNPGRIFLDGV